MDQTRLMHDDRVQKMLRIDKNQNANEIQIIRGLFPAEYTGTWSWLFVFSYNNDILNKVHSINFLLKKTFSNIFCTLYFVFLFCICIALYTLFLVFSVGGSGSSTLLLS